jgi:hypothetical protein
MLLGTPKIFRTMPGYSGPFLGGLSALPSGGRHASGICARGASRGKRARASGAAVQNRLQYWL